LAACELLIEKIICIIVKKYAFPPLFTDKLSKRHACEYITGYFYTVWKKITLWLADKAEKLLNQ
jgi:hypothetical protein